jgi:ribonuclease J
MMARDGFVLVNLTLDSQTKHLLEDPEIITRGFIYTRNGDDLLEETSQFVANAVHESHNGNMQSDVEQSLKSFLYNRTRRRPMIFVTLSRT